MKYLNSDQGSALPSSLCKNHGDHTDAHTLINMKLRKEHSLRLKKPSMTRLLGTENALRLTSLLHLGPRLYPLSINLYLFLRRQDMLI
ncbi:hypothetical protein BDV09DRAFT_179406 [Aspergillus tetrazonus]